MKLLGARVDALTMAYRVRLSDPFVTALKERAEVAREHGRAGLEFEGAPGMSIFGELRWSRTQKVWNVTNERVRLHIDLCAPGGGELRDCAHCRGQGFVPRWVGCLPCRGSGCARCKGNGGIEVSDACKRCEAGSIEEPGWTFEVVWSAQTLAVSGLEKALRESGTIASLAGDVYQSRLRRIDLCADVEGWEIRSEDVSRLAKRPRAKWSVDDAGIDDDRPRDNEGEDRKESRGCHGTGALRRRRITGISVGRGGALMARLYDKRAEVERDERRREAEEERWTAAGWDGVSPVARVEFQIRGVVLHEFGLRDPDGVVDPVTRETMAVCGECGAVRDGATEGETPGVARIRADYPRAKLPCDRCGSREVSEQATIVHRLPDVWRSCLEWVRLIVPGVTRNGRPVPVSRLPLDERWKLLHEVKWDARPARVIHRWRPRGVASAAQALGVSLSAAGRDGRLRSLSEAREAYADDARTLEALRRRVRALKRAEADRVVRWLESRYEGPAGAAVHFAVRANAARLRFKRGVVDADFATGPPDGDGPSSHLRARSVADDSTGTFDARGAVA